MADKVLRVGWRLLPHRLDHLPRAVHFPCGALLCRIPGMMNTHERRRMLLKRGVVGQGSLLLAVVLLLGVTVLGYGCFHQSKVAMFAGAAVVVAGCLSFAVRHLSASCAR